MKGVLEVTVPNSCYECVFHRCISDIFEVSIDWCTPKRKEISIEEYIKGLEITEWSNGFNGRASFCPIKIFE